MEEFVLIILLSVALVAVCVSHERSTLKIKRLERSSEFGISSMLIAPSEESRKYFVIERTLRWRAVPSANLNPLLFNNEEHALEAIKLLKNTDGHLLPVWVEDPKNEYTRKLSEILVYNDTKRFMEPDDKDKVI